MKDVPRLISFTGFILLALGAAGCDDDGVSVGDGVQLSLTGIVMDSIATVPLSGVSVEMADREYARTDSTGSYLFLIGFDLKKDVTFSKDGYRTRQFYAEDAAVPDSMGFHIHRLDVLMVPE